MNLKDPGSTTVPVSKAAQRHSRSETRQRRTTALRQLQAGIEWNRQPWVAFALLIAFLLALGANGAHGQTVLTNGGNHDGAIAAFQTNSWTLSANAGENIFLRLGSVGYRPLIRLFAPGGVEVASDNGAGGGRDAYIAYTATNSGTFTVTVQANTSGQSGPYTLRYAKVPGAFIVPAGDEGGPLTNGGNHAGTNELGDLDLWTFAANAGETIFLRLGSVNYRPNIRLFEPGGQQVASDNSVSGAEDAYIAYAATNNGTFTVLAEAHAYGASGTYTLRYAKVPGAFIVPADDEGGPLTNAFQHTGSIELGDLDMWSFQVCRASVLSLTCEELSTTGIFNPRMHLFGQGGALLAVAEDAALAVIVYQPTNSGLFTLIVDGGNSGNTGTYRLTGTGLVDSGLRFCPLLVSGGILDIAAVGGTPGTNGVLYTTTNLLPPVVWSPIWTNSFDPSGLFQYTNTFNPNEPKRFFRLEHK